MIRPLHSHRLQTRLFQSADGGDRWLPLELELSPDEQGAALAVDLTDPRGVLLFTNRGALPMQWPPRSAADFGSGDIAVLQGDPTTLPLQCARSVLDGAPAGSGGPGFLLRPVANSREPLWDDHPIGSRACSPEGGVTVSGTRQNVSISQVTMIDGVRPFGFSGVNPTTVWHQGFLLLVPAGTAPAGTAIDG